MIRTNQGGSVASFIVVAAVLVLATAGLLYWVKQGDTPKVASPEVAISDTKPTKKSSESAQKVEENNTTSSTQTGNTNSSHSSSLGSNKKQQTSTGQSNSGSVSELSRTGPADGFLQLVMVGVLTGALVAYIQSLKVAPLGRSSL